MQYLFYLLETTTDHIIVFRTASEPQQLCEKLTHCGLCLRAEKNPDQLHPSYLLFSIADFCLEENFRRKLVFFCEIANIFAKTSKTKTTHHLFLPRTFLSTSVYYILSINFSLRTGSDKVLLNLVSLFIISFIDRMPLSNSTQPAPLDNDNKSLRTDNICECMQEEIESHLYFQKT